MKRAERRAAWAAVTELRQWIAMADEVRFLAGHMPISGSLILDPNTLNVLRALRQVHDSGDMAAVLSAPAVPWMHNRADQAAIRLRTFHWQLGKAEVSQALWRLRSALRNCATEERYRLGQALEEARLLRDELMEALAAAPHLNFDRDVLPPAEAALMQSLVDALGMFTEPATELLSPGCCLNNDCVRQHDCAGRIARIVEDLSDPDSRVSHVRDAAAAVQHAAGRDREQSVCLIDRVRQWEVRAGNVLTQEDRARDRLARRGKELLETAERLSLHGVDYLLLPLLPKDISLLEDLILLRDNSLHEDDAAFLDQVAATARRFLSTIEGRFSPNGLCLREGTCQELHQSFAVLDQEEGNVEGALGRLELPGRVTATSIEALANPSLAFLDHLPVHAHRCTVLSRGALAQAIKAAEAITGGRESEKKSRQRAHVAGDRIREAEIARSLQNLDLEVLQKTWAGGLRINSLRNAGLNNVWEVRQFIDGRDVADLPGVGGGSAFGIVQATMRIYEAVREETPVRIDTRRRDHQTHALLKALHRWEQSRKEQPTASEARAARALTDLLARNESASHIAMLAGSSATADGPIELLEGFSKRVLEAPSPADIWQDFLARPADYMSMLTRLGFLTEDEKNMRGNLPEEIVEAVRNKELKQSFLTASLRAYQSFGARFALVQEKVIIGDDMGLGKNLEALAVLAHLRATGRGRFLVVCPAAVVTNWIRETTKHTSLESHKLHGPRSNRDITARRWIRRGGVAITTYDLLPWVLEQLVDIGVDCAVFDEAHYIKNPEARRSIAAVRVLDAADRAILMTGTPLENRVDEFRQLIHYIRPDLARTAPDYLASHFRRHVAPAYIRRNQAEVGTELPEMIEINEWLEASPEDDRAYLVAVRESNFMAMRRAHMVSASSVKLRRLVEIVDEAQANGRRVIVYSYFKDVLSTVVRSLPGRVFGPLTGSMPGSHRQQLIDDFSHAPSGAVLVSQIAAGGVGLNIQSASVVVICEPQVKPSTEAQAIARAHRMGQTQRVQVHRLLSVNAIDERMREILADKQREFDTFAKTSVIVEHAPDAVDGSDTELARRVVQYERRRLLGESFRDTA